MRQCELLGISQSSFYYQPETDQFDADLMEKIDQIYTKCPFYGSRRIKEELLKDSIEIGRRKVRTLMKRMGIEAIYPKAKRNKTDQQNKIYPYLLKNVVIGRPNQVWSSDITYIRLAKGWLYLVAVIDWYSRYVLSWKISNTLDVGFCLTALQKALSIDKPEIFNTDQGSQFTSNIFTSELINNKILISMDGKGRAFDNIFIERLWRTVKYEEVYLNEYRNPTEAIRRLNDYLTFYNNKRLHQNLDYRCPRDVHFGERS